LRVAKVPLKEAVGHILLHNQTGPEGRKALKKGQRLSEEDLAVLQELGHEQVYVALLADEDVDENEAARRLGRVIAGEGIEASSATTGRVNLMAGMTGLFKVNVNELLAFNELDGITLATIPNNSMAQPKTLVGTIKIIPYGIHRARLEAAETIATRTQLVAIKPFVVHQAALITTGSEAAREKVVASFTPALRDRLAGYHTELLEGPYVPEDEAEISEALHWAFGTGAEMILIAGETSIMDVDDITPRAIKAVGGEIVHHGVPVEPGNLLLLAYRGDIPIVGAPGCAKSKSYNVVDMVLPRLAAGEHLTHRDLIELGHGGYLV
jgi:molybdopterin biosynthesis enzyme